MARRKKRKDKGSAPPVPESSPQSADISPPVDQWETEAIKAGAADEKKVVPMPGKAAEKPGIERKKSGISVATAVSGMFLTLALGLYLGSLLPGLFMNNEGGNALSPQPQPAAPAQMPDGGAAIAPKLRQSVADLEKRAAANPASAPDWINLGNIYFDAHQPQKAIGAYEHALSLAPENPDVLTDLGIMYREIGRYDKAVECFRKAVAIDPGHQNALFNAGVVLFNDMKLKAEAAAMWEQLLSVNPQAHAPNGIPLSEMIKELRQQPPGAAGNL